MLPKVMSEASNTARGRVGTRLMQSDAQKNTPKTAAALAHQVVDIAPHELHDKDEQTK